MIKRKFSEGHGTSINQKRYQYQRNSLSLFISDQQTTVSCKLTISWQRGSLINTIYQNETFGNSHNHFIIITYLITNNMKLFR